MSPLPLLQRRLRLWTALCIQSDSGVKSGPCRPEQCGRPRRVSGAVRAALVLPFHTLPSAGLEPGSQEDLALGLVARIPHGVPKQSWKAWFPEHPQPGPERKG